MKILRQENDGRHNHWIWTNKQQTKKQTKKKI